MKRIKGQAIATNAILLGVAQNSVAQSGVTGEVDLIGLTTTVTVPNGGRSVKISVFLPLVVGTDGERCRVNIKQDGAIVRQNYARLSSVGDPRLFEAILTPTPGSHVFKATIQRDTGANSMSMYQDSSTFSFIAVEAM